MNKKLFTILLVAIFLIASVGFISAADSDDGNGPSKTTVKINWNGGSDRPGSVTVNLIKDGKVVDSATLSAANSWSAKFTVSGDGSYSVQESGDLSEYSVSTRGDVSSGFVITNTFNGDALGAAESDDTLEADEDAEIYTATEDANLADDNQTVKNETEDNQTDSNTTDNDTKTIDDDTKTIEEDTETIEEDTEVVTSPAKEKVDVVKKVEKKVVKKTEKKPKEVTKNKLRNTGIPVIGLVLVAIAAAFVPFTRKK